ncbi:MAG: DUF4832 domain-containing protein, partial [Lentisphaeria bacterium]|nr:DUF4832 domain-containing protein [Lentisphaeria bacterium]
IGPDDPHGRAGLRNPERGFRTEIYFSCLPGEIAGTCSCHSKQLKLDGRSEKPVFQNVEIPGVPHIIRGNRLDGIEFSHRQWSDELDYLAYDGVTVMQSYCFLMKYDDGRDLPQEKLDDIETFFLKVREAGAKCLLRFAYELSPTLQGPDAETTLKHLLQLRPMLRKYGDVIYVLQCGFVGKFGEWHNSFHFLQDDLGFRRELISAVLESLPAGCKTMMRYPFLKQQLFGTAPISEKDAFSALPEARIGHFNDGFLAGPSHGGTFNRIPGQPFEADRAYLAQESRYLPQDGELFWRDVAGAALPQEAAKLFSLWHYDTFGMVHGNVLFEGVDGYSIDIWKRVPVDPMFLIANHLPWSEAYFRDAQGRHVWRSYYEYIRDHLGYRIELQSFEYEISEQRLTGKIRLTNRGFSAPVNFRPVFLVLGEQRFELATDIRKWYSGEMQVLNFDLPLPPAGDYEAGFWLPDGSEILRSREEYAIHCANPLEFKNGINCFGIKIKI